MSGRKYNYYFWLQQPLLGGCVSWPQLLDGPPCFSSVFKNQHLWGSRYLAKAHWSSVPSAWPIQCRLLKRINGHQWCTAPQCSQYVFVFSHTAGLSRRLAICNPAQGTMLVIPNTIILVLQSHCDKKTHRNNSDELI